MTLIGIQRNDYQNYKYIKMRNRKIYLLFLVIFCCSVSCKKQKEIVLLSYNKELTNYYPEHQDLCLSWHLDSLEIIEILQNSVETYFIEVDAVYNTWSCEYYVECLIDNKYYKVFINAGGYCAIVPSLNEDIDKHYLIYLKDNDFFLDTRHDFNEEGL